jgi:CRISPR system Cascade subunit CasA
LTAEYSKAAGGTSPWLYGAALDLPTDWGQRRDSRVQSADLTALQAFYAYAETLWTTYSKIKHGLIDRHYADQEQQIASELVFARSSAVTLMKQRVAQGEEPDLALVRVKSDLAAAQSFERAAKARRARADQVLADGLGVTADKVERLKITPQAQDSPLDPTDLMTWRREAVLVRKDVLSAVAAYERSDLELRLAYAKQYPEVRLGPGYVWERGVNKLPLSIGLSLPPYDLNRAAIAEADARRKEAGKALESSQAAVLAAVDQAWTALKQAQTTRDQADQVDLPLARKAFDSAQMSYRFGETDGLDFAFAKAAIAEATLSAIQARHLASLAQADLEDALRRPFALQDRTVLQSAVDRLKAKP